MGKTTLRKFEPTATVPSNLFLKWLPALFFIVFLGCFLLPATRGHAVETSPATSSTGNSWNSLTADQKKVLTPIAGDWGAMPAQSQKKWLAIAGKYPQMKPEDQQRLQEKMNTWHKLTPEQRLAARENYIRANKFQPEQRAQKWQEYQQLSDEQKAQLASHEKKKLITNLPTPAESKEKKLAPLKTPKKPAVAPQAIPIPTVPATIPTTTTN